MSQSFGFVDLKQPSYVCYLKKVLYGLKQSSHAWHHELQQFFISNRFVNSHSNTSSFLFRQNHLTFFMLVYVDDLIIISSV